jgi:hypothetical protein
VVGGGYFLPASVCAVPNVVSFHRLCLLTPVVALAGYGLAGAQSGGPAARKKLVSGTAPRPTFSRLERGAFFENAAEQLGPEPTPETVSVPAANDATSASAAPADGVVWSTMISAEALESEVKTLAKLVEGAVKTPNEFKGGGFKTARRDFTTLAALFGVIAEFDGEVRWKSQAAALRDAFGRAGKNCKVGTDGTYAEAKRRADELAGLLRGETPTLDPGAAEFLWSETADRPPLMERLEIARTERLKPWTGGKGEFTAHREEVAHEAAIVTALAHVIQHPSYDYAEDEGYLQYVKELETAAIEAQAATKQSDFDGAQGAVGKIGKSCDACHGDYR